MPELTVVGIQKKYWLHKLLRSWDTTLAVHERRWGADEAPWAYFEQTNVGLLAEAAGQSNGLWMMETPEFKRPSFDQRLRPNVGRLDLWLEAPTGTQYAFEAAQLHWNLFARASLTSAVQATLDSAMEDFERIRRNDRWPNSQALAFISVYTTEAGRRRAEKDPDYAEVYLHDLWQELTDIKGLEASWAAVRSPDTTAGGTREWLRRPCVAIVGERLRTETVKSAA